jgi:cytochrome c oxidase subunit III
MGEEHAPATATTDAHGHGHGHGHDPNLAHHFDTMDQQVESGKLGMWLFLATEVLLFAGLFCAYAVYRANHPEVFVYAHVYLDKVWGGVNTVILLLSSFTMALAVRSASLGNNRHTMMFLGLTVVGALGFLGVKAIEYTGKIKHGTLWGARYQPHGEHPAEHPAHAAAEPRRLPESAYAGVEAPTPWSQAPGLLEQPGSVVAKPKLIPDVPTTDGRVDPAALPTEAPVSKEVTDRVHQFFGIYFVMTGLHGLHVVIGMCAILWIMWRTSKGHFTPGYYLPVDLVGLYWHLVDLIWIYLFPLLYLIA